MLPVNRCLFVPPQTGREIAPSRAFVARTATRVSFVEKWLAIRDADLTLSIDETRNEPSVYRELFANECRAELEEFYRDAMSNLRGSTLVEGRDGLNALAFLQEVVARAMWKYGCTAGPLLESFARKYDRLDTLEEKRRLHLEAQE